MVVKEEYRISSQDGKSSLHCIMWKPESEPVAVLQIAQGALFRGAYKSITPEDLEQLCSRCDNYAKHWEGPANALWAQSHGKGRES